MSWAFFWLGPLGGLGACVRWQLDSRIKRQVPGFSVLGIFAVNVVACFLLGLLLGAENRVPSLAAAHALLVTGFLGGFSTFSTAVVDVAKLCLARRYVMALALGAGTFLVSLAAFYLGQVLVD